MLELLYSALGNAGLEIHAVEVKLGGLTEGVSSGERFPVYSVTKSVTSAAFSLAWDDGLVSPEQPLAQYLDADVQPLVPEGFAKLPFHRFLTMTAGGYPMRPDGVNWQRSILSLGTDYSDEGYHYSNIPAYLVGAAVENAVGGDLAGYLSRRLFTPLGISEPPHQTSPEGHFYGATGMELSAHELVLLGQMYLQNGSGLISERAVRQSVTGHTGTGYGDRYGYFFRVAEDHFAMVGKWGQRCMIYPEKQLVIAYLSHQPERSDELFRVVRSWCEQL